MKPSKFIQMQVVLTQEEQSPYKTYMPKSFTLPVIYALDDNGNIWCKADNEEQKSHDWRLVNEVSAPLDKAMD